MLDISTATQKIRRSLGTAGNPRGRNALGSQTVATNNFVSGGDYNEEAKFSSQL